MARATADHPPRPTTPAGRVAALADALESRARALAPLRQSSRVLGPDLSDDALELVRAEVLGRSLLRRPPVFVPGLSGRPAPRRPGPAGGAAPAPTPGRARW